MEDINMENQEQTQKQETQQKQQSSVDLLKAMQDLKNNSVSKEDYEKVVQEKNDLINQALNNLNSKDSQSKKEEQFDYAKEISEVLKSDCSLNNLEYWEKVIKCRDHKLTKDNVDIFLPNGRDVAITSIETDSANRVAATIKECIKYANGDSAIFTQELNRRMAGNSYR